MFCYKELKRLYGLQQGEVGKCRSKEQLSERSIEQSEPMKLSQDEITKESTAI